MELRISVWSEGWQCFCLGWEGLILYKHIRHTGWQGFDWGANTCAAVQEIKPVCTWAAIYQNARGSLALPLRITEIGISPCMAWNHSFPLCGYHVMLHHRRQKCAANPPFSEYIQLYWITEGKEQQCAAAMDKPKTSKGQRAQKAALVYRSSYSLAF